MDGESHCSRCGEPLPPGARHEACAPEGDGHRTRLFGEGPGPEETTIVPGPRPIKAALGGLSRHRLELFEELGGGAMGVVYRGRDHLLGRDVAVKVLHQKYRDDPEMVLRFRAEAQVGGQLQHPGIPPLHDTGTLPDGLPYFTMKLVGGRTLERLLEEGRTPPDRLLDIVQQIAEAVGYAHERGVIHRDLKPGNVMVGAHGEVQVMDWGLAKVLRRPDPDPEAPAADAVATVRSESGEHESMSGRVLGTYAYMAPEQARGEKDKIDRRADVFALGSILCKALTGKATYAGGDSREVWGKAVRCDTAEALDRLDTCGADRSLITLARRCLEPEPADRPPDARAVAGQIGDHLAGVRARLEQARYALAVAEVRADEERKRRVLAGSRLRLAVALALAVLALVVVGGGAAAWFVQDLRARFEQQRSLLDDTDVAIDRAEAADEGRVAAELAQAHMRYEQAATSAADGPAAWKGRLAAAEVRLGRLASSRELVEALETARGGWAEHSDEIRAEEDYARAFRDHGLDADATAPEAFAAAIVGESARIEVAAALDNWGVIRRRREGPATLPSWQVPVRLARALDRDQGRDRLRASWLGSVEQGKAALVRFSEQERMVAELSPAGSLLLSELLTAAGAAERSFVVLQGAWRRHPGDFWINFNLGSLALSRRLEQLRPEHAARHFAAALAMRPASPIAHTRLGTALFHQGQTDEAEACLRKVIALRPAEPAGHFNLGFMLAQLGRHSEAEASYRAAVGVDPEFAAAHRYLGDLYRGQGRVGEAAASYRAAIRLRPDATSAHLHLGNLERNQGRHGAAESAYRAVLAHQPDHPEALCSLGLALHGQGRFAEALTPLRRGHKLGKAQPGWPYPSARWLAEVEQLAALEPRLAAVLAGRDRPRNASERVGMAIACHLKGRYVAATRLYAEAFAEEPRLAAVPEHRFRAAGIAAMAAAGRGRDEPIPDEAAAVRLRARSLAWLRAGLQGWTNRWIKDWPRKPRQWVAALEQLPKTSDLASVTGPEAIARLPEAEQPHWRALWADATALLRMARTRED